MSNIEAALVALDIDFYVRGEEANALCPMHEAITGKEDHNPSWWINLQTGQHICFSCGYKGGLLSLVCDLNDFFTEQWGGVREHSYPQAKAWLSTVTDVDPAEMIRQLSSLQGYVRQTVAPVPMSEARLAVYDEVPEEILASRKLTIEAANEYEVKWDTQNQRWILPLRNASTNKLMGWQEKGHLDRSFKNCPAGIAKSTTLFGLNLQLEDQVVVVESPLDAVRIRSVGIQGAVATCGAIVSKEQVKLLRASEKIICAFDNPKVDAAGKKASEFMRQAARQYGMNLFFFDYAETGAKDPGDMTAAQIISGVENAKSSVWGEAAYV